MGGEGVAHEEGLEGNPVELSTCQPSHDVEAEHIRRIIPGASPQVHLHATRFRRS